MKSIAQQLQRSLFLTITVIVSLMSLAYFGIEVLSFQQLVAESVVPRAEMLGIHLRRPLAQGDAWGAQEILTTLSSDPTIRGAYLFDRQMQPVAYYQPPGRPGQKLQQEEGDIRQQEQILPILQSKERRQIFSWKYLSVFVPIIHNNETIGTVYIISSLSPFYLRLAWWLIATTLATVIANAAGLTLARRLNQKITTPITDLAHMMQTVTEEGDLTPRAKVSGEGEIATLSQGFNRMIEAVQARDNELIHINFDLEERIAARTAELRLSIQEKELLLREIHHRVKNNLQIISSLFRLQLKKVGNPDAIEALQSSLSRVRSISLIHEKLYISGQSQLDQELGSYLKELSEEIFRLHNISQSRIRLDLDLVPIKVSFDQLIPIALILNELLTNTFKHAYSSSDEGRVLIKLRSRGEQVILTILDEGRGLPEEFLLESATTVGLRLTTNLVQQAKGQFNLLRRQPGTEAVVIYPLTKI